MAKAIKSQADQRDHRLFVDQHDRVWDAVIEKETGDPCSTLRPRFRAPWMLPEDQKYYLYRTDPTDLQFLKLDYDRYIDDIYRAREDLKRVLHQVGVHRYKEAYDANHPPEEIVAKYGSPDALASPVPAIMAKRGDPWVLGVLREDGSAHPKPTWADAITEFAIRPSLDDRILAEQALLSDLPEVATPARGPGRPASARRRRALAAARA